MWCHHDTWYMMTSVKNVTLYLKIAFIFMKVFKLLSMCAKFQVNQWQVSVQKKVRVNFTLTPFQWLLGQITLVTIGLIELTVPSDAFNHKSFFKYWILQTTLQTFLLYIFVWNKIFCSRKGAVFLFFWFGLGWHLVLQ